VTELRQRYRQTKRAALRLLVELGRRLICGARVVELHVRGPASATPIIDSVVTRSISIGSVKSSVPEGRSGITNHREMPLLSQTLISVLSGSSTPTSAEDPLLPVFDENPLVYAQRLEAQRLRQPFQAADVVLQFHDAGPPSAVVAAAVA
jgi:uncharacterized protein (DUF849 family)